MFIQFVKERTYILFYRSSEAYEDIDLAHRTQQWWQRCSGQELQLFYNCVPILNQNFEKVQRRKFFA